MILFPGTFNASGFHDEILNMKPGDSGHGVDNCIRHLDFKNPDSYHKSFFLMGIYAERLNRERDLKGSFTDPSKHEQFFKFQKKIINQFFEFITTIDINLEELTVTFFDGCNIGFQDGKKTKNKDRDKLLVKSYSLPMDVGGLSALQSYIRPDSKKLNPRQLFPVKSLANIDINPVEGALVGPRLEVAIKGFEIATIVFDYYKIEEGKLIPIDYLGGYAVGMERLTVAKNNDISHLYNTGLMESAYFLLESYAPKKDGFDPVINAPIFGSSVNQLLSSTEALIHLSRTSYDSIANSKNRRTLVNELKDTIRSTADEMGFENENIVKFIKDFTNLIRERLPEPFNQVNSEFILDVIKNE